MQEAATESPEKGPGDPEGLRPDLPGRDAGCGGRVSGPGFSSVNTYSKMEVIAASPEKCCCWGEEGRLGELGRCYLNKGTNSQLGDK